MDLLLSALSLELNCVFVLPKKKEGTNALCPQHRSVAYSINLLHIFLETKAPVLRNDHPPATRKQYGNSGSESPETERRYLAQRAPRSVSLLRPRWCEFSIRSVLRVLRSFITLGSTLLLCRGRTLPRGSETPGSVSISITSQRSVPGRITRILPGARVRILTTTQYRGKPGYYCRAWRGPMEQPFFIFDWFSKCNNETDCVALVYGRRSQDVCGSALPDPVQGLSSLVHVVYSLPIDVVICAHLDNASRLHRD